MIFLGNINGKYIFKNASVQFSSVAQSCLTLFDPMNCSRPGLPVHHQLPEERVCLQCRRPGFDPWVGKILWRREWKSTPVSLPGESPGQRRLVGYRLWGRKESDMTEQLLLKYACVYIYMYWAGQKSLWVFPQDVIEKYEQTFWPTQYK